MPLKDHKQELWCVSVIAGLVKHRAAERERSQQLLVGALKGIVLKKEQQELDVVLQQVAGVGWGEW